MRPVIVLLSAVATLLAPLGLSAQVPTATETAQKNHLLRVIGKLANGTTLTFRKGASSYTELVSAGFPPSLARACLRVEPLLGNYRSPNPDFYAAGFNRLWVFTFRTDAEPEQLVRQLASTGLFNYVEEDGAGSAGGQEIVIPNDPYFNRQWALRNLGDFPPGHAGKVDADIDADEAWDIATGDSSVLVAILDSGCRLGHPELAGRLWTNPGEIPGNGVDDDGDGFVDDVHGWDFVYRNGDLLDTLGHGTNVTGIIAANPNNSRGYAGVDWHCKVMICKVLRADNFGYYSWWASAIIYAVDHGAKIINMSLGGTSYSGLLKNAVEYAYNHGVTIAACMMNDGTDTPYYPAKYQHTIAVGATDTDDTRCQRFFWGGGSNYGSHIDVVAPGNYIYGLSARSDNNYGTYWAGTSQATAFVTGVLSLLAGQDTTRDPDELRQLLTESAEDTVGDPFEDTPGWDIFYGYGRINARRALELATGVSRVAAGKARGASTLTLAPAFPSPSNGAVTLVYSLPREQRVSLFIYDTTGREVRKIALGIQKPGRHRIRVRTGVLASGVYVAKLCTAQGTATTKFTLLK